MLPRTPVNGSEGLSPQLRHLSAVRYSSGFSPTIAGSQNALSQSALGKCESDGELQSSVVEDQSSILGQQSSILEQQSSILDQQSSIVEDRSSVLEQHSSILEQSSVVEDQSSVLEQQSSILEQQSSVLCNSLLTADLRTPKSVNHTPDITDRTPADEHGPLFTSATPKLTNSQPSSLGRGSLSHASKRLDESVQNTPSLVTRHRTLLPSPLVSGRFSTPTQALSFLQDIQPPTPFQHAEFDLDTSEDELLSQDELPCDEIRAESIGALHSPRNAQSPILNPFPGSVVKQSKHSADPNSSKPHPQASEVIVSSPGKVRRSTVEHIGHSE